jgi:hypothetical protein
LAATVRAKNQSLDLPRFEPSDPLRRSANDVGLFGSATAENANEKVKSTTPINRIKRWCFMDPSWQGNVPMSVVGL